MTPGAFIVYVTIVFIIAAVAYTVRRGYDRRETRASFVPEYTRVETDPGETRAADRELAWRTRTRAALRLDRISAADQDFYATSWERIQGDFLDDPALALSDAGRLAHRLLTARGYSTAAQDGRLALPQVQYAGNLAEYRQALSVTQRLRTDPASVSVEEQHTALVQYQAFFTDLLAIPGTAAPRPIPESGGAP